MLLASFRRQSPREYDKGRARLRDHFRTSIEIDTHEWLRLALLPDKMSKECLEAFRCKLPPPPTHASPPDASTFSPNPVRVPKHTVASSSAKATRSSPLPSPAGSADTPEVIIAVYLTHKGRGWVLGRQAKLWRARALLYRRRIF